MLSFDRKHGLNANNDAVSHAASQGSTSGNQRTREIPFGGCFMATKKWNHFKYMAKISLKLISVNRKPKLLYRVSVRECWHEVREKGGFSNSDIHGEYSLLVSLLSNKGPPTSFKCISLSPARRPRAEGNSLFPRWVRRVPEKKVKCTSMIN